MLSCIRFRQSTVNEVVAAIRRLPDNNCIIDVLEMLQLIFVVDVIAPLLSELFNCSMSTATVPVNFRSAFVMPLLKKSKTWMLSMFNHTEGFRISQSSPNCWSTSFTTRYWSTSTASIHGTFCCVCSRPTGPTSCHQHQLYQQQPFELVCFAINMRPKPGKLQ